MNCPHCDKEMVFKSGVSKKNGQPYKMYKCEPCDFIKFVNPPKAQASPGGVPASVPVVDVKLELLAMAKDIVVAEIAKGGVEAPFKRLADGFKALLRVHAHPFGEKVVEEEAEDSEPVPF